MGRIERIIEAGSDESERNPEVTTIYACEECSEEFESTDEDPMDASCPVCGSECVSVRPAVY
jgi:DNA-directed RNA polymerase subunit RPC12/RpoP